MTTCIAIMQGKGTGEDRRGGEGREARGGYEWDGKSDGKQAGP